MRILLPFALLALSACATAPQIWTDITGQNRPNGVLQMADGQCQMYSQQVADQTAASLAPAHSKWSGAANGIAIINARQDAYANCMRSLGWAIQ